MSMTYPAEPIGFDEYVRLAELHGWERVELDDGMVHEMAQEGPGHVYGRHDVLFPLARYFGEDRVYGPGTVVLDDRNALEPDLFVFKEGDRPARTGYLQAHQVALMVEVAVSSLRRDLIRKARKYAKAGIEEYWVIDVEGGVLHRHTDPTPEGYARITHHDVGEHAESIDVAAILAPEPERRRDDPMDVHWPTT